ncbi:hypothetical protein BDFB_008895 [Asbolus verrucosus]|uniref:WD40 domain containing protein n=1 Tax=Asbolus verrucosus TaxID=1661398 RepID=A0A482VH40_ASBVE|nr:hypothetical protein BDFB_008895 [Asbolus verrucosus]
MPLHVTCRADDSDKHEFDVNNLIFHKGKLYSAADDGKIKTWTPDLKLLQEVQAHPCSVYCVTANDDTLYSCSNEGAVKSFDLETLQEKQTLIREDDTEFWRILHCNGVLYIGDDQGNVRLYKNEKFYGSINVAIPVKEMLVKDNLLFTSKDNDVIVTDLRLQGEKPQFGIKATIVGRGPLAVLDDKTIFMNRDGKEIILSIIGEAQNIKELSKVVGAHEMIINASVATKWDGKPLLFTAGWDKVVKQWKIENDAVKPDGSYQVDFIVNAMVEGAKGQIYAAGSDGHLVRLEL